MTKHEAEELAHEINAQRPQTHRAACMWHEPGTYRVEIVSMRTLQRTFAFSRDEYLAARMRELKAGGAAVH